MNRETLDKDSILRESAEAGQLLEHPAFTSTLAKLEGVYFRRLRNSKQDEKSLRDDCYRMLRALEEFKLALTHTRDKAKTLQRTESHERNRAVV